MRQKSEHDLVLENGNPYEILYPRKRTVSSCDETCESVTRPKPEILLNGNVRDAQTLPPEKGVHEGAGNRVRSSTMPIPSSKRLSTTSGRFQTRSKSHVPAMDPRMRTFKRNGVLIGQKKKRKRPRDHVCFLLFSFF